MNEDCKLQYHASETLAQTNQEYKTRDISFVLVLTPIIKTKQMLWYIYAQHMTFVTYKLHTKIEI